MASSIFFSSVWMREPPLPPPEATFTALVLLLPISRLLSLSRSEWRNAFEQIHQMTRAQAQIAMRIITNMASNLHHLVE